MEAIAYSWAFSARALALPQGVFGPQGIFELSVGHYCQDFS